MTDDVRSPAGAAQEHNGAVLNGKARYFDKNKWPRLVLISFRVETECSYGDSQIIFEISLALHSKSTRRNISPTFFVFAKVLRGISIFSEHI